MPGQGVENVPNVGASLESREVGKSYRIAKDRLVREADDVSLTIEAGPFAAVTGAVSGLSEPTLVSATAARIPARAMRHLPPPACSPEK
jgi:hypothetical protein